MIFQTRLGGELVIVPLSSDAHDMLYSGIDLHKRPLAIHTVDAAGTVMRKADLPATRAAVSAYFAMLKGPHQAVCECTSMWYWVRDLLVPQDISSRLAHAKYLEATSCAKAKTDAVDAATMAQLLRVQLMTEAHVIREGTREVHDLLRARLQWASRWMQCQRVIDSMPEKYDVVTLAVIPE